MNSTLVEAILSEAVALPVDMRRAFIMERCGQDHDKADRVLALLEGYQENSDYLETPAVAAVVPAANCAFHASPAPGPGDCIGRYRLLELIGEGGFGIVYVAEQQEPIRRLVALKLIRVGMDTSEFVARFDAERQTLALMDHPNIARVFDAGATENGRPYLVMELVCGTPITKYCDEHRVSMRGRLELFIGVCGAIQHAHHKGVIHRDLKPSNILIANEANASVPKVIDFGIAKAIAGPLEKTFVTQHHTVIGTPAYTSPEQLEIGARNIDARSDLYSLGALLYELLTSNPPFDRAILERASFDEMRRTIRETEPLRPSEQVRALTPDERWAVAERRSIESAKLSALLATDLDWIVMRCLEKEPSRRYETANALAVDLRRHLENEPVAARPPSRIYRLQKFTRRNRVAVFAVVAIMFSLLGGLITAELALLRERAAAEKSRQVAQFMKAMLGAIGPSVARGRDTELLREVLDNTIRRLDTELGDQPEVAADLRHTLGVALQEIGDYARATTLWREAIAARRALGDEHSVELAATLHQLGSLLWRMNQAAEADSALREALSIRRKTLGPAHFDVGTTLAAIAYNPGSSRTGREREALSREAVAIQQKYPGHDDDQLAQTFMILGYVLFSRDRHEEAREALHKSIELRRAVHRGPHPNLAESLSMLVRSTDLLRGTPDANLEEERKLLREVLLMVREVRGLANARLIATLLAFTAGKIPPATLRDDLSLAREVVDDLRGALPEGSPDLAVAQLAFAFALELHLEHSDEAKSLAREAIGRLRDARENNAWPHPDTSAAMQLFAMRTHAAGRLHHARVMAEQLIADARFGSVLMSGPPAGHILGLIYYDLGRYLEAAPLLESSPLASRRHWRSAGQAMVFIDFAYAGDAYRKLGRISDSRRILEAGLARKVDEEETDSAKLARGAVRGELGYTAIMEHRFAEAEALLREALREYDAAPPNIWDKHRPRGRIVSGLGQALAAQGKFAEAEALIVDGFSELKAKRKTFWGDPTLAIREAGEAVVQFYRDWDKADHAAEWEQKLSEL